MSFQRIGDSETLIEYRTITRTGDFSTCFNGCYRVHTQDAARLQHIDDSRVRRRYSADVRGRIPAYNYATETDDDPGVESIETHTCTLYEVVSCI